MRKFLWGVFFGLLLTIIEYKRISPTIIKIVGTPTYHQVIDPKFYDGTGNTSMYWLDQETKMKKHLTFWWWLHAPKVYDVPENQLEYITWKQNNIFYLDVRYHVHESYFK